MEGKRKYPTFQTLNSKANEDILLITKMLYKLFISKKSIDGCGISAFISNLLKTAIWHFVTQVLIYQMGYLMAYIHDGISHDMFSVFLLSDVHFLESTYYN